MVRDLLPILCENFNENRLVIQNTLSWQNSYIYPVCASVFMDDVIARDEAGDTYVKKEFVSGEKLEQCKELLKSETGVFSNFRGNVKVPVICMLAADSEPEIRLAKALEVYEMLKQQFMSSEYLALAAMYITKIAEQENYQDIVYRAKSIYKLMKKEHPFLTFSEDSVFAALLALSEKSDEELVKEIEACYVILKQRFNGSNVVQSLSHVLALCEGTAEYKCQRVFALYDGLYQKGCKYSKGFELATLGVLAMLPADISEIVDDIVEVDECLYFKKGYGRWGRYNKRQRLMHAGLVVSSAYIGNNNMTMNCTVISSIISMVTAQQAALCAIIASQAAANAAT